MYATEMEISYLGTYTVTAEAEDMAGWNAKSLADAIREPLEEVGVLVICKPQQHDGGGFVAHDPESSETLAEEVFRIVTEIATETERAG